jgi:hypothetical protein
LQSQVSGCPKKSLFNPVNRQSTVYIIEMVLRKFGVVEVIAGIPVPDLENTRFRQAFSKLSGFAPVAQLDRATAF